MKPCPLCGTTDDRHPRWCHADLLGQRAGMTVVGTLAQCDAPLGEVHWPEEFYP